MMIVLRLFQTLFYPNTFCHCQQSRFTNFCLRQMYEYEAIPKYPCRHCSQWRRCRRA